jgi:propionyl-CoA synthetase
LTSIRSLFKFSLGLADMIEKENPYYNKKYEEAYKKSLANPEEFWTEVGKLVSWTKPWERVLDNSHPPFTKWYGEVLNHTET